jgi:hypothetical protein
VLVPPNLIHGRYYAIEIKRWQTSTCKVKLLAPRAKRMRNALLTVAREIGGYDTGGKAKMAAGENLIPCDHLSAQYSVL